MREYLFRGKRAFKLWRDKDPWIYGSLIQAKDYCCILDPDEEDDMDYPYLDGDLGTIDGEATPVIPETVGQFTGMYDKNGKRIFEGDIVYAKMDYGPAGFIDRVVDISFKKKDGYRWEYFDLDTIVVIGNVHDNIELLNVDTNVTDILKGVTHETS